MAPYHTIPYHISASADHLAVHLAPLIHDATCAVDLLLAAIYLTTVLVLLLNHRWVWLCYLALATTHAAAAALHGGLLP